MRSLDRTKYCRRSFFLGRPFGSATLSCVFMLLFTSPLELIAQWDEVDSVYWAVIMPDRHEKFLQTRTPFTAQILDPASKQHNITIRTIDSALHQLSDRKLSSRNLESLYDYMDSAAVHFHRQGTPIFLTWGDVIINRGADMMLLEKEKGVLYVYLEGGCVLDLREGNAIELFNHRTTLLQESAGNKKLNDKIKQLRKGFRKDEKYARRVDRYISRHARH